METWFLAPSYILALGAMRFRCDEAGSALQALSDAVEALGGPDLELNDCHAGCELAADEDEFLREALGGECLSIMLFAGGVTTAEPARRSCSGALEPLWSSRRCALIGSSPPTTWRSIRSAM